MVEISQEKLNKLIGTYATEGGKEALKQHTGDQVGINTQGIFGPYTIIENPLTGEQHPEKDVSEETAIKHSNVSSVIGQVFAEFLGFGQGLIKDYTDTSEIDEMGSLNNLPTAGGQGQAGPTTEDIVNGGDDMPEEEYGGILGEEGLTTEHPDEEEYEETTEQPAELEEGGEGRVPEEEYGKILGNNPIYVIGSEGTSINFGGTHVGNKQGYSRKGYPLTNSDEDKNYDIEINPNGGIRYISKNNGE